MVLYSCLVYKVVLFPKEPTVFSRCIASRRRFARRWMNILRNPNQATEGFDTIDLAPDDHHAKDCE